MKIIINALAERDYTTAYRIGNYNPNDLRPSRWQTEVSIEKGKVYVVQQDTDDPIRYLVVDERAGRKNKTYVPAEVFTLLIPTVEDLDGEGRWEMI